MTFKEKREEKIFGSVCPLDDPYAAGYRGECQNFRDSKSNILKSNISMSNVSMSDVSMTNEVRERLWTIVSRLESETCRWKVVEHFCAFLFSPIGLCVPPGVLEVGQSELYDVSKLRFNERVYPKIGRRQSFEENVEENDFLLKPPRLGFIILVHKDASAAVQLLETIYR